VEKKVGQVVLVTLMCRRNRKYSCI